MRKPSLHDLVYARTHPKPRQNDPVSFYAHVQRNLVPEVRIEVQTYYGGIDCLEAQYPGLDYTYPPHRKRMSRYAWHRRLFRVFDELGLTDGEILSLCQWEGTRAAKERFERESKAKIEITTLDKVMVLPEGNGPRAVFHSIEDSKKPTESKEETTTTLGRLDEEVEQSDEDEADISIGVQLNQQLRAAADARARGEPAVFDEQWEQWMKEALERNEMDLDRILEAIREGRPFPTLATAEDDSENLPEAEIEEEEEVNQSPEVEQSNTFSRDATPTRPTTSRLSVPTPQTYDELHSMLDELQSNNTRLAADNAAMAHFLSRSRTETAR